MVRLIGVFAAAAREADADGEEVQFEFCGENFTITGHLGTAPLMKFAAALENHDSTRDVRFLAAMDALIKDCLVDQNEYERFMSVAATHKAGADDIFKVCRAVWDELTGRPTKRPADSSDGPLPASKSSNAKSIESGSPMDTAPATRARTGSTRSRRA